MRESVNGYVVRLRRASLKTVQYGAEAQQNNFVTQRLNSDVLNQFLMRFLMPNRQRVLSSNSGTLGDSMEFAKREKVLSY